MVPIVRMLAKVSVVRFLGVATGISLGGLGLLELGWLGTSLGVREPSSGTIDIMGSLTLW